ncbi:helix-turn-helix domain-containing protein [Halalkalibacter flavus]|uniref:helix-turn-helix domain-containing protein n=1 Tax=Halalkalibacter flavus TaxID=3090668 RepID=UPI002FC9AC21
MSKKPITIIASESTYQNLSTFTHITDLNNAVRSYKEQFADQLNKTQVAVLDLLHRYSAKYKGVSFLTKNKIGELIGKSRVTIIRACKALEYFGIIKQYEMKRSSDMQQTSNAIQIQPLELVGISEEQNTESIVTNGDKRKVETQAIEKVIHQQDQTFLKQNQNNQNNDTHVPTLNDLDHTFVSKDIPQPFINAVKPFYSTAVEIKALYNKVRLAYRRANLDVTLDELTIDVVKTFKACIYELKQNKVRKDFKGYWFRACERTFDEVYYAELRELLASEKVSV